MNKNISKQNLIKFLQNEPLVIIDDNTKEFDTSLINKDSNIFIGIGLCTKRQVSTELPFDILGMILFAEKLRRKLLLNKVIIQIADTHALTNKLTSEKEIIKITDKTKNTLIQILKNLKLENFEVLKASEIDKSKFTKAWEDKILENRNVTNEYIKGEVFDIEFFKQEFSTKIKISWIIPASGDKGNDERLFDSLHKELFGKTVNFLHLKPGHTFEKLHWRTSPYIHLKGENRILFKKREDVERKFMTAERVWQNKAVGGARNHLKNIVRCFESLFGNLTNLTLEEKTKFIIEKSLK